MDSKVETPSKLGSSSAGHHPARQKIQSGAHVHTYFCRDIGESLAERLWKLHEPKVDWPVRITAPDYPEEAGLSGYGDCGPG